MNPQPLPLPGADLCDEYLRELPVTGAAISIFVGTSNETRVTATDSTAVALDEAQFTVGEGPRWDAVRTRIPVTVADTGAAHLTWPGLGSTLADTGAAAVFVLPLTVGAVDVGVIELYRDRPGILSPAHIARAQALAGKTSWKLLHLILDQDRHESGPSDIEPLARREIHQATGMILVQADVSAADALLLLRAHAFARGQSLDDAAHAVISRDVTFAPEPGPHHDTSLDEPRINPDPATEPTMDPDSVSDHAGLEED